MNTSTFTFLLFGCIALAACSDLKEDTSQVKTFDEHFQTDEEARNFILPIYGYLYPGTYFERIVLIQSIVSDEIAPLARLRYDDKYWRYLQQHDLEEWEADEAWNYWYDAISVCNQLMNELQASSYPDVAAPYLAEVKAFRAFIYLHLIDAYGNVPIVETYDSNAKPCTSPRSEVFAFIEKSLLEAMPLLAKNTGSEFYGRMNFYVAQAILAKLYLNAEVYRGAPAWQQAAAACDAIINSGRFILSDDYFGNFKINSQNSAEIILSTSCFYSNCSWTPPYVFSLHFTHLGSLFGESYSYQPNFLVVQPDYFQLFDSQDARIKSFFVGEQFDAAGNPILDLDAEPNDPDGLPINYTPEVNLDTPLHQAGIRFAKFEIDTMCPQFGCFSTDHKYPIFRYADILLMKAEALLRQDANSGEALLLVNQVRQRSGAAPFGELSLEKLLDERGRELFLEGWRRSDLIRFGKFNEAWWEKPADASAHVNLFPIPWQAIYANACLAQNPGY